MLRIVLLFLVLSTVGATNAQFDFNNDINSYTDSLVKYRADTALNKNRINITGTCPMRPETFIVQSAIMQLQKNNGQKTVYGLFVRPSVYYLIKSRVVSPEYAQKKLALFNWDLAYFANTSQYIDNAVIPLEIETDDWYCKQALILMFESLADTTARNVFQNITEGFEYQNIFKRKNHVIDSLEKYFVNDTLFFRNISNTDILTKRYIRKIIEALSLSKTITLKNRKYFTRAVQFANATFAQEYDGKSNANIFIPNYWIKHNNSAVFPSLDKRGSFVMMYTALYEGKRTDRCQVLKRFFGLKKQLRQHYLTKSFFNLQSKTGETGVFNYIFEGTY